MDAAASNPSGVLSAARTLLDGILDSVRNRIQLLSVELQEEKLRLVQTLIFVAAVVFSGMMAIAFASLTLIYFFWENARLAALGGVTAFYVIAAIVLSWQLQRYLARQPRLFNATLTELGKDRACIQPDN